MKGGSCDVIKFLYVHDTHSFVQDHVEGKAECRNKECSNQCELQKGVEDAVEHENIDAQQWHSLQEEDEVDPGKEDSNCSQLPLPRTGTPAVGTKLAHKDDR